MTLEATIQKFGQDHLLEHLKNLEASERKILEAQFSQIDFAQLHALTSGHDTAPDWQALAMRAESPPAVRLNEPHEQYGAEAALVAGEQALREGRLATIIVAGGQGTRLGFDHPKGVFPIGPLSGRTLFQMHIDRMRAVMKRYGVSIPIYVMTSPATDEETRQYFDANQNFGLTSDQLVIFCQGTMPAVDAKNGRVLLASRTELALSPDGHGGLVNALHKSGCLDDAKQRGIEHFFYAQVDNPLVQLCDPQLVGYHLLSRSQVTTQVVRKRFAKEKVGNVVSVDGKVQIIEYSDLPDNAAEKTLADGSLKLWAGNIAVHVFERRFLESVVTSADGLPFHRAHKAVPFLNSAGELEKPEQPNAIKFERFVFDLLPLADRSIVVEGDASEIFAPVKNAEGAAVDTATHAQQALIQLHRRWLLDAGAQISEQVRVEIHPAWALDSRSVKEKVVLPLHVEADTLFL
jgi:UDP-N-acetylglucosamine/UDP-N-acetylgalactosamine diphosphorylase